MGEVPDTVRAIVKNTYTDKNVASRLLNPEAVILNKNWEEVFKMLKKESIGPGTNAAVLPNVTLQYYDSFCRGGC